MPSIHVFRKKRKRKDGSVYFDKKYSCEIRFGRNVKFLRSTGCTTEREAKARAKEIAREIEQKELPVYGKSFMTISQMFGRWWMEYGHTMRTAETAQIRVRNVLKHIDENLPLHELSNSHINEYIQKRFDDGVTGSTINREIDVLRSAIKRASVKWEEKVNNIFWDEFKEQEPGEREIFVAPAKVKEIISYLPLHIALAVAWSVKTGCRLNETETLLKTNIHFEFMIAQVFAKGGGLRTVPLSDEALQIVQKSMELSETEYVFKMTNRRRYWTAAKKKAELPDLRWHDLRHITGSWLREFANSDQKLIQKGLGHKHSGSTDRYVHAAPKEVLAAFNSLPRLT